MASLKFTEPDWLDNVIKYLVSKGYIFNKEVKDVNYYNIIFRVITTKDFLMVVQIINTIVDDKCLSLNFDINKKSELFSYGPTILSFMLEYGCKDLSIIERLIVLGADYTCILSYKSIVENIDTLKLLLKYKLDPNAYEFYGGYSHIMYETTLLSEWIHKKDHVNVLLENGADPNIYGGDGRVPLHSAIYGAYKESALLLLKYGADPTLHLKKLCLWDYGPEDEMNSIRHVFAVMANIAGLMLSKRLEKRKNNPIKLDPRILIKMYSEYLLPTR